MEEPSKQISAAAGALADDLIMSEIATRLPAKSVARFRCVSKRWLSDTTALDFTLTHASAFASSSVSGFFLCNPPNAQVEHFNLGDEGGGGSSSGLSFLDYKGLPTEFIDARNGLLLLRQGRTAASTSSSRDFCVCNPAAGSYHFVPQPADPSFAPQQLNLHFDPSFSPHFKLLALQGGSGRDGDHGKFFLYSSRSRRWRVVKVVSLYRSRCLWAAKAVQWNQALIYYDYGRNMLISLDLGRKQVTQLPMPDTGAAAQRCRYLGESRGCLHYIGKPVPETAYSVINFDVWELASDDPSLLSWSILYRIDIGRIRHVYPEVNVPIMPPLQGTEPSMLALVEVVCFCRGAGGEGDVLLLSIPAGKIVSCRVRDMSFTTVCEGIPYTYMKPVYSWRQFYTHTQTLFTFNDDNGASKSHKDWIYWSNKHDKQLMALMVEHSLKGQRCKLGFTMGAWHDMLVKLNAKTKLIEDVSNLEDRLLSYRREFHLVNKIMSLEGFTWDSTQELVIADDAKWTDLHKRNPNLEIYRRKKVPFNDLEIICGPLIPDIDEKAQAKHFITKHRPSEVSAGFVTKSWRRTTSIILARKISAYYFKQRICYRKRKDNAR